MNIHTQQIDQTVHSIAADIAMLAQRTGPIFVCTGGRGRRRVASSFNSAAGVLHRSETTAGAARSSSRAAARRGRYRATCQAARRCAAPRRRLCSSSSHVYSRRTRSRSRACRSSISATKTRRAARWRPTCLLGQLGVTQQRACACWSQRALLWT